MSWLRWLFCPHDWSKLIGEWATTNIITKGEAKIKLYQCSKCTRFKTVKIS